MNQNTEQIRDDILNALLPHIAFDGWQWRAIRQAARDAGYEEAMAEAVFPGKAGDIITHFSDWADRQMLVALAGTDPQALRVRDRIRTAVLARLEILTPHKEAVRLAMSYGALPHHSPQAAKFIWRTADRIWDWAGDETTDYNRYTKRGLLSGVLGATSMTWLNDDSPDMTITRDFLDRRIENVMQLGRVIGKMKQPFGKKTS